jgi:hypothetical protein
MPVHVLGIKLLLSSQCLSLRAPSFSKLFEDINTFKFSLLINSFILYSTAEEKPKRRRKEDTMMKLMMLGMMLKSKFSAIATVFGTIMQLKFFALSMLNLLVGVVRLYLDLTKKKEPEKVIYYEQAHHEHVYDQQHEDKEWLGGWLSKTDDTVSHNINGDPHRLAYRGQKPSTQHKWM